jgi:hypothetical protein
MSGKYWNIRFSHIVKSFIHHKTILGMKIKQFIIERDGAGIAPALNANLILVFGERHRMEAVNPYTKLHTSFPNATIITCSTAGEIISNEVMDDAIIATAIELEKTRTRTCAINIANFNNSAEAGAYIVHQLLADGLMHIMVFADGQLVNGSELANAMNNAHNRPISISGGLAGDNGRFEKTLVGLNDNIKPGNIVAIGFYGSNIKIGHGSKGGWDPFGPERKITKSVDNVLYELDGKPALDLYKQYLGELADGLPGTGLLFPLSIKVEGQNEPLVRTILGVNNEDGSMTFAGNMPEGTYARLMKANFDRLVDAAAEAAAHSLEKLDDNNAELAICISCVGRKLVLDQRIDEEVESVRDVLGQNAVIAGFYSYGEISPMERNSKCELHNQTMTITTLSEV